jgi:hypothetical protein
MIFIEEISECDKAADIYQCGREKAPAMTAIIHSSFATKSEATGVTFLINTLAEKLTQYQFQTTGSGIYPVVPIDLRFCRMKDLPCVSAPPKLLKFVI